MGSRPLRLIFSARGTLTLFALLLALPASAAASTKSASTTLPAGAATGTVQAKCPHGQLATGGGFQTAPFSSPSAAVVVFESRKVGQRSWQVSGAKGGGAPAPATLTSFVYCSDSAAKTKEKSTLVPVAASTTSFTSAVSCGGSGKAQAGGFLVPTVGPPFANVAFIVDSFRPPAKSWQSRAFYGGGAPTLTSYVYCAKAHAPKARPGSVTSSTNDELKTALSGNCKHSTHVLAGGFSQPDATFAGGGGLYLIPWESFRTGKSWQASEEHFGTLSTTLTSIAYCG